MSENLFAVTPDMLEAKLKQKHDALVTIADVACARLRNAHDCSPNVVHDLKEIVKICASEGAVIPPNEMPT